MKPLWMLGLSLWLASGTALAAPINVAQGAAVTLNGTYGVLRVPDPSNWPQNPVAAGATLTDGLFLPRATLWNDGSVWWDAFAPQDVSADNSIEIALGAVYMIAGFTVAADHGVLKEAEAGMPVKELCRKHGFSDAAFYGWRCEVRRDASQ